MKYRTRDYSRDTNPFTGEPWRTPAEFFGDALDNTRARKLRKTEQKLAKREYADMSSSERARVREYAELSDEDRMKVDYMMEQLHK